MPRRREVAKRKILPDPKFQDRLLAKFINDMMRKGEKAVAERVCYRAMDLVQQRTNDDPLKTFKKALDNVKPVLEVKSRRVGGATYQVPVEVRQDRRTALAMRWLIDYAKERGEKTMDQKLAAELIDASNNRGNAVKKREDTHKMAEANKAFAHYRWYQTCSRSERVEQSCGSAPPRGAWTRSGLREDGPMPSLDLLGWTAARDASFAPFEERGLHPARVMSEHKGGLALSWEGGELLGSPSARLRAAARAAVGDWVAFEPPETGHRAWV